MGLDIEKDTEELRHAPLVDHDVLRPADRTRLKAVIDHLQGNGRNARVVLLPSGTDMTPWHALWHDLKLDEQRDLLLLCNGGRWEARGFGLTHEQLTERLDTAAPTLNQDAVSGLILALEYLGGLRALPPRADGQARDDKDQPASESSSGKGGDLAPALLATLGGGALLFGGALFLFSRRRRAVEAAGRAELATALAAAERSYAAVAPAIDKLAGDTASELHRKAGGIKSRLEKVAAESRTRKASDPVTLGRVRQLESEIAALQIEADKERAARAK